MNRDGFNAGETGETHFRIRFQRHFTTVPCI